MQIKERKALEAARLLADDVLYLYEQRWDTDEDIAKLQEPLDAFSRACENLAFGGSDARAR